MDGRLSGTRAVIHDLQWRGDRWSEGQACQSYMPRQNLNRGVLFITGEVRLDYLVSRETVLS